MTPRPTSVNPGAPSSLRSLLRRAHMGLAFGAVAIVGVVLALPALATVHFYAVHDLQLVGRAIGNTVEAAVVFDDAEAAQEALNSILEAEDVGTATVIGRNGRILATWQENASGVGASFRAAATRLSLVDPAAVSVLHEGAIAGRVELRSGGHTLLRFMALGLLGILCCQFLIAVGALYLSGRIVGRIIRPLHALADITGTVQRERAFSRRVPASEIAELDDLGSSFNVLLAELDTWQAFMEGENQRLSHQATHDSLTNLPNRAFFEGRLDRAVADARLTGSGLAVMFADCNRFKEINDGFGHAAGDAVLVAIAARLKGQFRERDLVARLGGDEFAILIAPGHAELAALADTLARPMQISLPPLDEITLSMSLSVGLAIYPGDGTTAAALLKKADEQMYRAKRARSVCPEPATGRHPFGPRS